MIIFTMSESSDKWFGNCQYRAAELWRFET